MVITALKLFSPDNYNINKGFLPFCTYYQNCNKTKKDEGMGEFIVILKWMYVRPEFLSYFTHRLSNGFVLTVFTPRSPFNYDQNKVILLFYTYYQFFLKCNGLLLF